MSESQKNQNNDAEVRELSLEEMDEISGGLRKQEQNDKLGNSEDEQK